MNCAFWFSPFQLNAGSCYLCAMRLQGVIQIGGIGGQFLAHFKKTVEESRYEVRSELGHLCTFD